MSSYKKPLYTACVDIDNSSHSTAYLTVFGSDFRLKLLQLIMMTQSLILVAVVCLAAMIATTEAITCNATPAQVSDMSAVCSDCASFICNYNSYKKYRFSTYHFYRPRFKTHNFSCLKSPYTAPSTTTYVANCASRCGGSTACQSTI